MGTSHTYILCAVYFKGHPQLTYVLVKSCVLPSAGCVCLFSYFSNKSRYKLFQLCTMHAAFACRELGGIDYV